MKNKKKQIIASIVAVLLLVLLTDALPVSDTVGKSYSTEGKVFDFSIEATNSGTEVIPYEITLRKKILQH